MKKPKFARAENRLTFSKNNTEIDYFYSFIIRLTHCSGFFSFSSARDRRLGSCFMRHEKSIIITFSVRNTGTCTVRYCIVYRTLLLRAMIGPFPGLFSLFQNTARTTPLRAVSRRNEVFKTCRHRNAGWYSISSPLMYTTATNVLRSRTRGRSSGCLW